MKIEDIVFQRKRFIAERLESFGFQKTEEGYEYAADFMEGAFCGVLTVTKDGEIKGKVIDNMNGDEYTPLRSDSYNGAYVNSVRTAYKEFLHLIADACCKDVLFASDQANRIAERIWERYSVRPDFPWGQSPHENSGTFRHPENNKWFALIMNVKKDALLKNGDKERVDVVNLKVDPDRTDGLYKTPGVFPAYHMNHKSWISVTLNEQLTDDQVLSLVRSSFCVTK